MKNASAQFHPVELGFSINRSGMGSENNRVAIYRASQAWIEAMVKAQ
jgi:hypothetical protein